MARYSIGIDLGTSNCALAFVDLLDPHATIQVLPILQLEQGGITTEAPTLPSFLYLALPDEARSGLLSISGVSNAQPKYAVGRFARSQSAIQPQRVISSAKSWLCHDGVDREDKILPWESTDIPRHERLSPVEASARYLEHLKHCWDVSVARSADTTFVNQQITITVPASFDEPSIELTLKAAKLAGYPAAVRVLEEPQAAFYCWLAQQGEKLSATFLPGAQELTILSCDIGGGTTDFSIFTAARHAAEENEDNIEIMRVAVSDHLLLGGDNIDLTLSHLAASRIQGNRKRLSPRQWGHLVAAVRALKEQILSDEDVSLQEELRVAIPGEGASLLAGSLTVALNKDEIVSTIRDGFFPLVPKHARPEQRSSALVDWGLPFPADTAVTRHLAEFIAGRTIDAVLFNGGVLKPEPLRAHLLEIIASWQLRTPAELRNHDLELAVAIGAAHYGKVLQTRRGRIKGGYSHSLYLELPATADGSPSAVQAFCLIPRGFEAGAVSFAEHRFKLTVNQPIRLQLWASNVRADAAGDIVRLTDGEARRLPPVQTIVSPTQLPRDAINVEVKLEAQLSDVGLFQLFCTPVTGDLTNNRWALDFDLRRSEAFNYASVLERAPEELIDSGTQLITDTFERREPKVKPKFLVKELESAFGQTRHEWGLPLLRGLWPGLAKTMTKRDRSVEHETAWLGLAGTLLRPGYGAQLDPLRMQELWRVFNLGLAFPREPRSSIQWWIMWRRVCGGLDQPQQEKIAGPLMQLLRKRTELSSEAWRLLAALERIRREWRQEIGEQIVEKISSGRAKHVSDLIWAFGRLASRVPLYADSHKVVDPTVIPIWYHALKDLNWRAPELTNLIDAFAKAARLTGDAEHDIDQNTRSEIVRKMQSSGATAQQLRLVTEHVLVDLSDRASLFGESLPGGLQLV